MKFVCIDFETANMYRNSICQAGLAVVENGVITETKSWYVNPDSFFEDFNVRIHGITADMVAESPKIDELWSELSQYILDCDFVVAHNARFDVLALDSALNQFENIETPEYCFLCSLAMSRRAWSGLPSYSLQSLCKMLDIEYGAHDACGDAKSCAELTLKIFEKQGVDPSMQLEKEDDVSLLLDKLQIYLGVINKEGFWSSVCQRKGRVKPEKYVVGDETKNDPENIFYQKKVAFTGTLSSMLRAEAAQKIADIGGIISGGVTQDTNFLIVGQQDYRIVGESGMSSKQKKALALNEKGFEIEIMSEEEFLKNI